MPNETINLTRIKAVMDCDVCKKDAAFFRNSEVITAKWALCEECTTLEAEPMYCFEVAFAAGVPDSVMDKHHTYQKGGHISWQDWKAWKQETLVR